MTVTGKRVATGARSIGTEICIGSVMLACFLACYCTCLPCLVVLSLPPQPLLEQVVFTILATMAMGGQGSAEEYTPTLEAEGSERNIEVPSSPRSPGEVANEEAPSLRTPDFSPPSGFGPAAQNAVPRQPAASNQNVPAASDQNVPAASDQNVPAASDQNVAVALVQDATGAVPDLASPAETEDLDSWGPQWPGDGPSSKKFRVSPGIPRQGIPSNVAAGSVVPGATALNLSVGEQLLIRALREESERRWREVVQIGGLAPPSHEAEEPRPLLSHYYGVPPVEQMYDSVAMLGVPGFLLRTLSNPAGLLAGNVGVGGGHGTTGQERLPFPSEMAEETPPIRQISSAPFPEPREVPKVEKPLGIDQSTQTQEDQDRWNLWLHRCLVGKGLTEYGVTQADLTLAKDLVTKMDLPSQRRDKRWKQRQQQADPLSVLLYLQTAERCLLSYTRSPTGYAGLIGGMPSRQLETPQGVFQLEVRKAWDLIECSVFVRMGALQQKANERRARQRARSSIRAASAKSGPQPRLPSSSASSSSSGEENVSSYAPAEREAFGRLSTMRASGGKLWQTVEQLLGFAPGTLDHSVERAAPQEASAASGSVASGSRGGGSSESHVDGRELSAGRGNCLHLWTTSCSSGDGPLSVGRGACTSGRAGPKEATNPSEGSSECWPDGGRTELWAPKPRGRAVRIFCGASCFSGALLRGHSGIRQQVDSRGSTSFGRASGGCLRSLGSPIWAYEGPPVDLPIGDCMLAAACPREFFKECSAGIAPATRGGKMCFTWHVGCEHVLRHDWHDFVQAQTPNTSNLASWACPKGFVGCKGEEGGPHFISFDLHDFTRISLHD